MELYINQPTLLYINQMFQDVSFWVRCQMMSGTGSSKSTLGTQGPKTDRLERMGRPDDTSLSDGNFSMPCATWNSEMIQSGKGRLDSAATEMADRILPMNKVRVCSRWHYIPTKWIHLVNRELQFFFINSTLRWCNTFMLRGICFPCGRSGKVPG